MLVLKKYVKSLLICILAPICIGVVATAQDSVNASGDVNGDERIDSLDAAMALQYGLYLRIPPTYESEIAADVTGDGRIDSLDASLILQLGLGIRPTNNISSTRLNDTIPISYQFSCTTSGGTPPFTYSWDFDSDGLEDANEAAPIEDFLSEEHYEVTLTTTDSLGVNSIISYDCNVDITPPSEPLDFSVIVLNGACKLVWSASASDEELKGYYVYRKSEKESAFSRQNDEPAGLSWLDRSVENDIVYEYYVTAIDLALNESTPTNTVPVVPGSRPARALWKSIDAQGAELVVEWQPVIEAVSYKIYYAEGMPSLLEAIDTVGAPTTTYTLSELPSDQVIYVAVAAVDAQDRTSPLSTTFEYCLCTTLTDTNLDGIPDDWCIAYGFDTQHDLAGDDTDEDGLSNLEEFQSHTNPTFPDTDLDGLRDGDEVHNRGTSPLIEDSDAGGLPDGSEIELGLDPLVPTDDLPSPPESLRAFRLDGDLLSLVWESSPDASTTGYNVYINNNNGSGYIKHNSSPATQAYYAVSITDTTNTLSFAVRSVKEDGTEGPFCAAIHGKFQNIAPDEETQLEFNGVSVTVPVGGVEEPTLIGAVTSPDISVFSPNRSAVEFLPDGQMFAVPAMITLPYDGAHISENLAQNLTISVFDGEAWVPAQDVSLDSVNHTISIPANHFSLYRIEINFWWGGAGLALQSLGVSEKDGQVCLSLAMEGSAYFVDFLDYFSYWFAGLTQDILIRQMLTNVWGHIIDVSITEADPFRTKVKELSVKRDLSRSGGYVRPPSAVFRHSVAGRKPVLAPHYCDASTLWEEFWSDISFKFMHFEFPIGTLEELDMQAGQCYYVKVRSLPMEHKGPSGLAPSLTFPRSNALRQKFCPGALEFIHTGPDAATEDLEERFTLRAQSSGGGPIEYEGVIFSFETCVAAPDGKVSWTPVNEDVPFPILAEYFARDVRGNEITETKYITVINTNDPPYFTVSPWANRESVIPLRGGVWSPDDGSPSEGINLSCEAHDDDLDLGAVVDEQLTYVWEVGPEGWTFENADAQGRGIGREVILIPPELSESQRRECHYCLVQCTVSDKDGIYETETVLNYMLRTKKWASYQHATWHSTSHWVDSYYEYVGCHVTTTDATRCGGWPSDGHDPMSDIYTGDELHWRYHPGYYVSSGYYTYETRWRWE